MRYLFIQHFRKFAEGIMPIRSYIKIYGPPLLKAIKALDKIAIDEKKIPARAHGEKLGYYDYCFEWTRGNPNSSQFHRLIEKIDEALAPIGVRYTIETHVRL